MWGLARPHDTPPRFLDRRSTLVIEDRSGTVAVDLVVVVVGAIVRAAHRTSWCPGWLNVAHWDLQSRIETLVASNDVTEHYT